MTDAAAIPQAVLFNQDFTGPYSLSTNSAPEIVPSCCSDIPSAETWCVAYGELVRLAHYSAGTRLVEIAYFHTAPAALVFRIEALPVVRHQGPSEALESLRTIQHTFGGSASDVAKMLRVSRQMIYHYRNGMQPDVDNFRRMRLIASFADYVPRELRTSLEPVLKQPLPEGRTLLALLSAERPDVHLVRRVLLRASEDLAKRRKLTAALGYTMPSERQDIMRDRHATGKPVYVSDPDNSERILQIRPDNTRIRGRMVNRVFVADEE